MNYQETIDFLFSSLPMYQRQGKAAYKANLDNTRRLDAYFNHPHRAFRSIHVAGTNGKGSVCHMLASVLQESGLKTGLYTSPHLLDFRERIRVNGQPIPEQEVTAFVSRHQPVIREIRPSFFEMTVAMALDYFTRQQVDVAVIETGMGGRLDSTNIISPGLTIITNISMDHTAFLGKELTSIAREKGGIIKRGIPLVTGPTDPAAHQVLSAMAAEKQAPLERAEHHFETQFHTIDREGTMLLKVRRHKDNRLLTYAMGLSGNYQQENVITTLTAIEQLQQLGWFVPGSAVEKGLLSVVENTGIMGRWQTIGHNPRSICDTAHNPAGISAVMEQVRQVPWQHLHMVWSMVDDKDPDAILPLLPKQARYYFTRSSIPRSLDASQLAGKAGGYGLKGNIYPTVAEAYTAARREAGRRDMIFAGGSTFVVADLLTFLKGIGSTGY